MPITSDLFEAYLKCPTKCFLRSLGETGTNNSYANWVRTQYLSYSSEGIKQLLRRGRGHHWNNRLGGDAIAQMASIYTDLGAHTQSGIGYSRSGALDVRAQG
jgi:hypothetical protein